MTPHHKRILIRSLALGIVAAQVAWGHLTGVDQAVARDIAQWHSPELDALIRAVTFFGSTMWLMLLLAVSTVVSAGQRRWAPVLQLVSLAAVSFALEVVLRYGVAHWRPDTVAVPHPLDLIARFELAGFPSGHGIRSAVTFGWLAGLCPGRDLRSSTVRAGCWELIGLVAVSRVYLNRHWASDLAGSWLTAWVAFAVVRAWLMAARRIGSDVIRDPAT